MSPHCNVWTIYQRVDHHQLSVRGGAPAVDSRRQSPWARTGDCLPWGLRCRIRQPVRSCHHISFMTASEASLALCLLSHLPTTTTETTCSSLPDWIVTWRLKMLVSCWDLGSQNYTNGCHSFVLTHRIQCSRESAEGSPVAPTGRCWLGREGHESGRQLAQSPERARD